jgi:hypothetical protein
VKIDSVALGISTFSAKKEKENRCSDRDLAGVQQLQVWGICVGDARVKVVEKAMEQYALCRPGGQQVG